MQLTKNKNILLIGLSLILSLVSFTGVVNHLPNEAIKTALIVDDYDENTRFSIKYQNASKHNFVTYSRYSDYSFIKFQKHYNLKEITAFKIYTLKTLWLRAELLHVKLYSNFTHSTLYNKIA